MEQHNIQTPTDVYSLVTNRIIELLEAGTIPWRQPWTEAGIPKNLISKRAYRGVNLLLLNSLGYDQNLFLTWKQIKTIGGSVKKGEKANVIVFNKLVERQVEKDDETKIEKRSFLRYYKVFNVAQCTDIPEAFFSTLQDYQNEPHVDSERIIAEMPDCPIIRHEENEAFYVPSEDYINLPRLKSFTSSEGYYSTLFHELVHSTGHQKRVGRKEIYEHQSSGSDMYSIEEMVAEIGSCYLRSLANIPMIDLANSAAYVSNWLQVLKGDKRFVVVAASRAQQAVDYILNRKDNETKEEVNETFGETIIS